MEKYTKWDLDYLDLAKYWASKKSKDPSTKTGAIIVSPNNKIVSIGWNGFPQGVVDTKERLYDRETKYELIVHCEMNALISAERSVYGCTLYTWPFLSCTRCAVHMIQAGIKRVVAPELSFDLVGRWFQSVETSKSLFKEVGIEVVEIK